MFFIFSLLIAIETPWSSFYSRKAAGFRHKNISPMRFEIESFIAMIIIISDPSYLK